MLGRFFAKSPPIQPPRLWSHAWVMAAFSYLGMLCLVPLIFSRNNAYVDFHARQGIVLWSWSVLAIFSLHIPIVGPFFFSSSVLFILLLALMGLLSVFMTRTWSLPIISLLAKKL